MFRFTREIKDLQRFEKILLTFLEEGLGYYLKKGKFHSFIPLHRRVHIQKELSTEEELALRLRRSFEKLGPTFVKLGQLLSLRPDLVPPEFTKEFSKLQDSVRPVPFTKVKQTIEQDFGKSLDQLFKSFDKKPLASASIAQVHRATLKNGKKVAVKVLRPHVKEIIDEDLDILFFIAKRLEKHFPQIRNYHPLEIVKEFAFYTRREIDLRNEANNIERMQAQMKGHKEVLIPQIFRSYSSRRVLTLEFLEGISLDEKAKIKKLKIDTVKVAEQGFMLILEQSLLNGFFHADPHPANFLINKKGQLVLLDFGIMGELDLADRRKVIKFFTLVPEKNPEKSVDVVISLAKEIQSADLRSFKREAIRIMEEVYHDTISGKSAGKGIYEIISIGARFGVIFDANHVLMAKSLYQGEGLMLLLNPKFEVVQGIDHFTKQYIAKKFTPKALANDIKAGAYDFKDILEEFPDHVRKIIEKLEEPEKPQRFDVKQLHEFEEDLRKMGNRRGLSLFTALLLLTSLVLFQIEGRTHILGFPISIVLFGLAVLLLVYIMIRKF